MFFVHTAELSHWRGGMLTLSNDLEWSFSESRLLINNKHNFLLRVYVSLRWNNYSSGCSGGGGGSSSSHTERLWSWTSDGWELSNIDGCAALHYALAASEKHSASPDSITGGNARWLKCCLPHNCMQCEHMNSTCSVTQRSDWQVTLMSCDVWWSAPVYIALSDWWSCAHKQH